MGRKKHVRENEECGGGGGKSKKKNVAIDDDEYSIGTELSAEPTIQEEELAPAVAFSKRRGKKGKKDGVSRDMDTGDSDREAESVASLIGKTKNLRLGKSSASLFHAIDDEDDEAGQLSEEDDEPAVVFTGRSRGTSFSAAEENDADTEAIEEDDALGIIFSGKKKSSKKMNRIASSTMDTAVRRDLTSVSDLDQASLGVNGEDSDDNRGKKQTTDVLETSKNKTKKKKGGHTLREDEDEIDKILAELGEGSAIPGHASLPQEEKSQQQSQLGDDIGEREAVEEGAVESAAAKKKKKKKEKEKEKKAAAAAAAVSEMEEKQEVTKNDAKGKLADKKQSKQVREMQERLKKMKEAEERKKRKN